jgi:hypothetical protein
MKLPITIEYNSGEQATYVAQPPEWAKWEKTTGHTISQAKEKLGMWDLMFLAYNAHKSHPAGSLSRLLVELAIATQIPMSEWVDSDDILTAIEVLEQRYGK